MEPLEDALAACRAVKESYRQSFNPWHLATFWAAMRSTGGVIQ